MTAPQPGQAWPAELLGDVGFDEDDVVGQLATHLSGNRWDHLIHQLRSGPDIGFFRQANIDVGDSAYACKLWFESHGVVATAADIVAMAALVLAREAKLQANETALQDRADRSWADTASGASEAS